VRSDAVLVVGPHVVVARPTADDRDELLDAVAASRALHGEWVTAPDTAAAYGTFLARCGGPTFEGHLLRRREDGALIGVANVSEIVRGALQSAFVGYYGLVGGTGRGHLTEGVGLVAGRALGALGLHRIEANVQPANEPSRALLRRLGFRREGYSPRYLHLAGAWRDHERWALLADDPAATELVRRAAPPNHAR
jgi:ribosomal-protein-alanine N-acetyltransferase